MFITQDDTDLICDGVVPQQPPTIFTSPSIANSCRHKTVMVAQLLNKHLKKILFLLNLLDKTGLKRIKLIAQENLTPHSKRTSGPKPCQKNAPTHNHQGFHYRGLGFPIMSSRTPKCQSGKIKPLNWRLLLVESRHTLQKRWEGLREKGNAQR